MKRRRLPRWCRHPWKPLPKRWHRWRRCQKHARLTKREIDFLVSAAYEAPRRSRITRIDRVEMPILSFLRSPNHYHFNSKLFPRTKRRWPPLGWDSGCRRSGMR